MIICYVMFATLLGVVSAVVPDPARFSSQHVDHVVPRNITPQCLSHTTHWMSKLRQGEVWALKMVDSMTKLPSATLLGSNNHLGNYEECVSISVQDEEVSFQGQYFRAMSRIEIPGAPLTANATNAFCVPSTCNPDEIPLLMLEEVGPTLGINIYILDINPLNVYTKEVLSSFPTGAMIFVILTSIMVTVVVLCALTEWKLGEKTPAMVRACSLTSTCRSLFNTRKHPADISCLHGLRVGSMLWIILGHQYGQEMWGALTNAYVFKTYFENPLVMTVVNAMPSVDTFFFLSGLLMCTSFLNEVHRRNKFDVLKFYTYRYLRLAIPMGIVILLFITILPIIGTGPLWNNYFYYESRNCKANWYLNMAYVNNVIYNDGFWGCVGQTWYTAVDMQLAWLSPLVLLPLYHSPHAGLQLMTLLILISCFIPFTLTYIYHFNMSIVQVQVDVPMEGVPEGGNFGTMIYSGAQSRATPYLCGILFGYYLFHNKKHKINLPKSLVYLGWTCSTIVALTIIYSLSIPHQPNYVYNLLGSAFYAGFHRLGWSAVLIWIVFACVNGYGGAADKILSSNLLLPLSRLTYSVFLLHFISMIYISATTRSVSRFTDFDAVHDFFGALIPTYFISFLLYVLIEGPLLNTLRVVFSKGRQQLQKKNSKDEKNKNLS